MQVRPLSRPLSRPLARDVLSPKAPLGGKPAARARQRLVGGRPGVRSLYRPLAKPLCKPLQPWRLTVSGGRAAPVPAAGKGKAL